MKRKKFICRTCIKPCELSISEKCVAAPLSCAFGMGGKICQWKRMQDETIHVISIDPDTGITLKINVD